MLVWTVGLWMDPRWSVSNLWDSVIISPIWADLYRLSNIQRLLIISEQINTLNHVLQLAEFQVSDSSSPSWPRNTSLQTIFLLLFSSCTRLNSSSGTNFSYVFHTWTCDASKYQTSFFSRITRLCQPHYVYGKGLLLHSFLSSVSAIYCIFWPSGLLNHS